jgi:lipoate-protein ligase A
MMWRLIPFTRNNAAMNMAIDEAICRSVARRTSPPTIRFYGWEPSAVSVGCFQSIEDEVDLEACERLGVDVVRRRTGAGAVYHDSTGEVTYSVICPVDMMEEDISASYRRVCGWVMDTLDLMGIRSEFQPINDILVRGRKISGSAQTRREGVFLQHGTLLYDLDLERMFTVLKVDVEKMSDKELESVLDRVTSISTEADMSMDLVLRALRVGFTCGKEWEMGDLTAEEINEAGILSRERYSDDGWTLSR